MASKLSTDVKVGLTVVGGLIVLLAGIAWAKNWHFSHEQSLRIRFATTGGLGVGDPVSINGVVRGGVSAIDPGDSDVIVTVKFGQQIALHKNATARIMMLEVMGGKKIEMTTGSGPGLLADNALIDGEFSGDIGTLVAMVTDLSGTVRQLTGRADSMLASVNTFFQDNDLKGTVNKTMHDAQQTLEHFDVTAGKVNSMLDENAGPLKRTLAQAESATADLADFLKSDRPLIHNLLDTTNIVMHDARTLVLRATGVFGAVDSLLQSAGTNNTLLYKLTKDQQFSARLDSLTNNLNKFIEQLRKQGLDANIRFFSSSHPEP